MSRKHMWVAQWLALASWVGDLVYLFTPRSRRTVWFALTAIDCDWAGPCRTREDAVTLAYMVDSKATVVSVAPGRFVNGRAQIDYDKAAEVAVMTSNDKADTRHE